MSCFCEIDSPVGKLQLLEQNEQIVEIHFQNAGSERTPLAEWREGSPLLRELQSQLNAYFRRELREFDLPLNPSGTPFQLAVWEALRRIPYGETLSYGEVAAMIGRPMASRAVGAANGQNPIPIVIPCHRVIGSDGSLIGYGGGLDKKKILLELEGRFSDSLTAEPVQESLNLA